MPDVFLSFSEKDRKLAEKTQKALIQRGYDVWSWINKTPGDLAKTDQVQDVAKATIVIWTTNSIASDNVMKEADRAYQLKKLIPLKSKDLKIDSVPFRDGVIVSDLDEHGKLFEALYKKRVYPKGVLARFAMGLRYEGPGGGTIALILIAVAVLIFEGVFRGMGEDLWSVIKPLLASFVRW